MNHVAQIKGQAITQFSPRTVAQQFYREGEGLDANPYPAGTDEHDQYRWEMHSLQRDELARINEELRAGV